MPFYARLILILFFLYHPLALGFSIGAVQGVTCESTSGCDFKKTFLQYQPVHQMITKNALALPDVVFTPSGSNESIAFNLAQVQEIADANAQRDQDQFYAYHFDFAVDHEDYEEGIYEISKIYEYIGNTLKEPGDGITTDQASGLRKKFGAAMHTLQDFYSHTNWIHIDSSQDLKLWDKSDTKRQSLLNTALNGSQPCLNTPALGQFPLRNAPPGSGTYMGSILPTSGYAGGGLGLALALAPEHKCAHGLLDWIENGVHQQTGIHKDWASRDNFAPAYNRAMSASAEFAKAIINDPENNPISVCMFMTDRPCEPDGLYRISFREGLWESSYHGIVCLTQGDSTSCREDNSLIPGNGINGHLDHVFFGKCNASNNQAHGIVGAPYLCKKNGAFTQSRSKFTKSEVKPEYQNSMNRCQIDRTFSGRRIAEYFSLGSGVDDVVDFNQRKSSTMGRLTIELMPGNIGMYTEAVMDSGAYYAFEGLYTFWSKTSNKGELVDLKLTYISPSEPSYDPSLCDDTAGQ